MVTRRAAAAVADLGLHSAGAARLITPPTASLLRKQLDALKPFTNTTHETTALITARIAELRKREAIAQRTPEWHAARRSIITASEATAFLRRDPETLADYYADFAIPPSLQTFDDDSNLSPFMTEDGVLSEKITQKKRRSTNAMRWGVGFEPIALDIYTHMYARRIEQFGLLTHDTLPWLGASVDGIEHDTGTVVEIKCPYRQTELAGDQDEPPELHYWVQVQLQMETLALPNAYLFTCNFIEYADMDDFLSDPIQPRLAGCFLVPMRNNTKPTLPTLYPPGDLLILSSSRTTSEPTPLLDWIAETVEANPTYKPRYWYLASHTRKRIPRNQEWFRKVKPVLQRAHDMLSEGLEAAESD